MNIAISTLMIQRGKSGVAQYVFALLRAMARQNCGHRFIIFVLKEDASLFDFVKDSMSIVLVPEQYRPAVRSIFWHQQHLPHLVSKHQAQVLHIPSYRRLLWRKPCMLVGTVHDLAPFRVPKKYDWKRMLYGRVIVRWLAHRQDRIIAVSQNTANDIKLFFGLPGHRVRVIHNGLDHRRFFPGKPEQAKTWAAERHGLRHPFFLYVARLEHPGKNHLRLISAFEQFKNGTAAKWQLVLAGSDWHGAEAIHCAISQSPHRSDIRPLGFVADDELPELYRAADASVYPSLYEGFGMPPLEAMACGCPVISSNRGALAEVLGDAASIVFDPENPKELAGQLLRVASDERVRRELRMAGINRANQFDWARTAAETLRVYEQASAQAPAWHGRAVAAGN